MNDRRRACATAPMPPAHDAAPMTARWSWPPKSPRRAKVRLERPPRGSPRRAATAATAPRMTGSACVWRCESMCVSRCLALPRAELRLALGDHLAGVDPSRQCARDDRGEREEAPLRRSVSVGTTASGAPTSRLRCSPTSSRGDRARRRTPSCHPGQHTIIEVEVTMPAACASRMPAVTAGVKREIVSVDDQPPYGARCRRRGSSRSAAPVIEPHLQGRRHGHRRLGEVHRLGSYRNGSTRPSAARSEPCFCAT